MRYIKQIVKKMCVILLLVYITLNPMQPAKAKEFLKEYTCMDSFFLDHKNECKNGRWLFIADKNVMRYRNPLSKSEWDRPVKKGEHIWIEKIWQTAFESWGLIINGYDSEKNPIYLDNGWVKLSELTFTYDMNMFFTDHRKEMKLYSPEMPIENLEEKKDIIVWTYPCSGNIVEHIKGEEAPVAENGYIYQDEDGRYWTGCRIRKNGTRELSGAICLSEPENAKIPAKKLTPYTTPEQYGKISIKTIIFVCGAVILTCSFIFALFLKRKHPSRL